MQVSCIVHPPQYCVLGAVVRPYASSSSPTCHRCILRVVVGVLCVVVGFCASSLVPTYCRWFRNIVVGVLNVVPLGNSKCGH